MRTDPFRQVFADRDLERLVTLLADDVAFYSQVINEPGFESRHAVAALYAMVFESFSDVEFTHDFGDESMHISGARAKVLGRPIKWTTLLEFDADGSTRSG
jgi:hypothetical protein